MIPLEVIKMNKRIITAALTGSIHTPSMSPYLPVTPEQLIKEAIAVYHAGGAVVHIHVRDPLTGTPNAIRACIRKSQLKSKSGVTSYSVLPQGGNLGSH
jgi:uncharacterized protein (DUF849 family)